MNYAIVENEAVTNIIWLSPNNADEFANAVALYDKPVVIGDSYTNGRFYRNGEEIKTIGEQYADALLAIDDLLLIIGG